MPELKDKEDLSLLRFEGVNGPVHFVVSCAYGDENDTPEQVNGHAEYFYEEHSCPTNWLRNVVAVIDETGNEDPHGFLKHVRTARVAKDFDPSDIDPENCSWTALFPEAAPGYIPPDAPHEPVDDQFAEPAEMTDEERAEAARLRDAVEQRKTGLDATVVARAFEVMLPAHDGGLFICRNPHKAGAPTSVKEYLAILPNKPDFTGPTEQQKAETVGELWIVESRPNRDIFLAAASLPALAAWLQDNGLAFGS